MHIIHHELCLGEEWEWENKLQKHKVFVHHMSEYMCHHHIICITRSMTSKQTTPFNSLCLNISVMIASFASVGCNCKVYCAKCLLVFVYFAHPDNM